MLLNRRHHLFLPLPIFILVLIIPIQFIFIYRGYLTHSKVSAMNTLSAPPLHPSPKVLVMDTLPAHPLHPSPPLPFTALIAGLVRDNADTLHASAAQIEAIGSLFSSYSVVLVENDSSDGTGPMLSEWARANSRVTVSSHNFNNRKRPSHQFLADLRNKYLSHARSLPAASAPDVIVVLDIDLQAVDVEGVREASERVARGDHVGLTANGFTREGRYYDIFALKDPQRDLTWDTSVMGKIYVSKDGPKGDREMFEKWCPAICDDGSVIPVESAFSGVAVYSAKEALKCKYSSSDDECEHVAFSACLNENRGDKGQLSIATFMNVLYGLDHSSLMSWGQILEEWDLKHAEHENKLKVKNDCKVVGR